MVIVIAVAALELRPGQHAGQWPPAQPDLDAAMDRARYVRGIGKQVDPGRLGDQLVGEPFVIAGHFRLQVPAEGDLGADVDAGVPLRFEAGIITGHARRGDEQIARLRDAIAGADPGVQPNGIDRLPEQGRLRRDVGEMALRRDQAENRVRADRIGIGGLPNVDDRTLDADPGDEPEPRGELQLFPRPGAHIADVAEHRLGQRAESVAAGRSLVEAEALVIEIVVEEADEARRFHAEQRAATSDVRRDVVTVQRALERRRAGRLVDHPAVESGLGPPGRIRAEIMFVAHADDRPAVVARQIPFIGGLRDACAVDAVDQHRDRAAAGGCARRRNAALLIGIGEILIVREPGRQAEFAFIVDQLGGDPVAVAQRERAVSVDRAGFISGMAGRAVGADEAAEHGIVIARAGMADRRIEIGVTVTPEIGARLDTVDVTSAPGAEIGRAAQRIIAVARRRRTPHHVDRAIGMRIGKVEARQAIRLGDGEIILEHLDVACAETVAGVGTAH
ncbi:hypothetical protein MGWOODY_Smn2184 [hydrothermal vent metagenome]|uniref:Uncharacterized protein n=1 Tax=hydrothermal vent metagenome TaxID=652676 RepID=A0A160TN83_9ZZZZ